MSSRYEAKVVKVFDGDTIEVEIKKNHRKVIRFFGIDCPERNQEYGQFAGSRVRELLKDKKVDIFTIELGKYGREVAIVYINGYSIGETLIKEGLAFASGSNHKLASDYYKLQERARSNKTGMWKLGAVENPAIFRNKKRRPFYNVNTKLKSSTSDVINEKNIINDKKISILSQLKSFITEKISDFSDKEDKYISSEDLLQKIKIKNKNKPKV